MKRNVITTNPEIITAIYAGKDNKFITNKFGYITNLKDPDILTAYESFKDTQRARILSDNERFHFDTLMVRRFRPELNSLIDEVERREGTNLAKKVEKCSGIELLFDEGMEYEWIIKTPTESVQEKNGLVAVNLFTERINDALRKRVGKYYEDLGLSKYTGE